MRRREKVTEIRIARNLLERKRRVCRRVFAGDSELKGSKDWNIANAQTMNIEKGNKGGAFGDCTILLAT